MATLPSNGNFGYWNYNLPGSAADYQSFIIAGNQSVAQPLGVLQIGPFAFDDDGDSDVVLENEITDHWLEDNTAVQDQIGLHPVTVTLKGRISELVFTKAAAGTLSALLATVESPLVQADAYLGAYTPGVTDALLNAITQAQNVFTQIEQDAARVAQIASFFTGGIPGANNQQEAFITLSALRNARVLFSVYTPFQVFNNMAITSVHATQPGYEYNIRFHREHEAVEHRQRLELTGRVRRAVQR